MYSSHDNRSNALPTEGSLDKLTLPQDPAAKVLARAAETYSIPADKIREIALIQDPEERFAAAEKLHLIGLTKKAELFTASAHSSNLISADEAREILLIEDVEERFKAAQKAYFPLTAQGQTLALIKEGREKGVIDQLQINEIYKIDDLNQRYEFAKRLKEDGEKRDFVQRTVGKAVAEGLLKQEEASFLIHEADLDSSYEAAGRFKYLLESKETEVRLAVEVGELEGVLSKDDVKALLSRPLRKRLEKVEEIKDLVKKKVEAEDAIWGAVKMRAISRETALDMLAERPENLIKEAERASDLIKIKTEARELLRHGLELNVISRQEARTILRLEDVDRLHRSLDRIDSLLTVAERSEVLLDKGIEVGIITSAEAEGIFQEKDPYIREEAIRHILRAPSDRRILSRFQVSDPALPAPRTDRAVLFVQLPTSTPRQEYLIPHLLRVISDPSDVVAVPGVNSGVPVSPRDYSLVYSLSIQHVYGWDDNDARGASAVLLKEYQGMVERAKELRRSGEKGAEEEMIREAQLHFDAYESLADDRARSLYNSLRHLSKEHRGRRMIALIEGSMVDRLGKEEFAEKLESKFSTYFIKPAIPR